jgi:cobalt-zinc-cadmium efflux system membrane fusion protein
MKNTTVAILSLALFLAVNATGCKSNEGQSSEAPPAAEVVPEPTANLVQVDHPEQVGLTTVVDHESTSQLVVNGVVNPDVSLTVPVVTLASGRVIDIHAHLGDEVEKGQVLLQVRSDDVSSGYSDYRKAQSDELLARKQLDRAKDLYAHGAIAQYELESDQNAEDDARTSLDTTTEHLRLLGNDPDHPSGIVNITAPVSGVITDQQVTIGSSIQSYAANPFTISDLSHVWVLCDVYENQLSAVRLGEKADIRLAAYPDRVFQGTINNISSILDPSLRTAKVRIEVKNPGLMRVGMFTTVTFYGLRKQTHAAIPSNAILHLHDADWVFVPQGNNQFRRTEIVPGETLPDKMQEVLSGLAPGQKVVANALTLQNIADNE